MELRGDVLKAALTAQGVNVSDQAAEALALEIAKQQQLFERARAVQNSLIELDVWIAQNLGNPEPKRQALQSQITAWRTRFPALPVYTPKSTADILNEGNPP